MFSATFWPYQEVFCYGRVSSSLHFRVHPIPIGGDSMRNKLLAFLMAVTMMAASNASASAAPSCYFYVGGASGRLIIRNDGDVALTVSSGEYGMIYTTVPAGGWRYAGWPDEAAYATDSTGATICGWYPDAAG
jgi:hypothetical protein